MDKAIKEAVERIGKELREQLQGAEPADRWELRPTAVINHETGEFEKRPAHVVNYVRLMPDDILVACGAAKPSQVVNVFKSACGRARKDKPVIIQATHAKHLLDQVEANKETSKAPVASPSKPGRPPAGE